MTELSAAEALDLGFGGRTENGSGLVCVQISVRPLIATAVNLVLRSNPVFAENSDFRI